MDGNLPLAGATSQRKSLDDVRPRMAKADRKPLAEDWKREVGRAIERALELAHITKQDASDRMGYGTNQAPLSRWIAGVERPQFEKLFAVPELRQPLVQAFSELAGADVEINIRLRVSR